MRGKLFFSRRHGTSGIAALEFALVAPVIAAVLLGTADFGMACWEKAAVNNAAWAGVAYASVHGYSSGGISSAVTQATGLTSIQASPAPSEFTGCPVATGVASTSSGASCAAGGTARTYVQVNATTQYSLIIPLPGFSNPMTISTQAVARLQ